MCFQVFTYFACGHRDLDTYTCEDASADTPFFNPVNCPKYSINRGVPPFFCGSGAYYCKHDRDGGYLESVHADYNNAIYALSQVDHDIALVQRIASDGEREAVERGIPLPNFRVCTKYLMLEAELARLSKRKHDLQNAVDNTLQVISEAQVRYRICREQFAAGRGCPVPSLTLPNVGLGRTPAELKPQSLMPVLTERNGVPIGPAVLHTFAQTDYVTGMRNDAVPPRTIGAGGVDVVDLTIEDTSVPKIKAPLQEVAEHQGQTNRLMQPPNQGFDVRQAQAMRPPPLPPKTRGDSHKHPRSEAKVPEQQKDDLISQQTESTHSDNANLRRSERVRGNKGKVVSYAEGSDSDDSSWEESPTMSPPPNQLLPSSNDGFKPIAKRGVGGSKIQQVDQSPLTMRGKIHEWQHRESLGGHLFTPTPRNAISETATGELSLEEQVEQVVRRNTARGLQYTGSLTSTSKKSSGRAKAFPDAFSPLPNVGEVPANPIVRGYSTNMYQPLTTSHYGQAQTNSGWNNNLLPPNVYSLGSMGTKTKKRAMPSSSPMLPPAKRTRVSLTGEDINPPLSFCPRSNASFGDIMPQSLSSPPKMESTRFLQPHDHFNEDLFSAMSGTTEFAAPVNTGTPLLSEQPKVGTADVHPKTTPATGGNSEQQITNDDAVGADPTDIDWNSFLLDDSWELFPEPHLKDS